MLQIQPQVSSESLNQKLILTGTIDVEAKPVIESLYILPDNCIIKLDFTNVKRVNSTGLAQLLKLFEYWQKRNISIHINNANRMTSVLFKMTGLTRLLTEETPFEKIQPTAAVKTKSDDKFLTDSAKSHQKIYEQAKSYYDHKQYENALTLFIKAAELGNDNGQFYLGYMYAHGYGVLKDYNKAVEWFRKAAEQGNVRSQVNLGTMYGAGYGVEKDYHKAMIWFRKAAAQGDIAGQNKLGFMYENGYGVERDYKKAKEWYLKAAVQGDEYANKRLQELDQL